MKQIFAGVLALTLCTSGAQAQDGPVAIGTLPQGSLGYSIAAGIAQVVDRKTGMMARAVGQGGSSVYVPSLNRGEIAFATSNAFESVFAIEGRGNFDGQPNPQVRVAAMLQPFSVGFMVAADSDIQSIGDFEGQAFPVGYARQRLVGVMQEALFEAAGLSEDSLDAVPVANFVEGANMLAQGTVQGVLLAPGSGVVQQTNAQRAVRFISAIESEEMADQLAVSLPGSFLMRVDPNERMPEIVESVDLLGYQYTLITHADADDELVYKVVKALYESRDALIETHGSFRAFNPDDMANQVEGAIFHPGAIRFFREAGIWSE